MTASTAIAAPVKGLVFEHSRRIEWDGSPRRYTVTSVRQGKVHYIDSLRIKQRCRVENWEKVVGRVVSVPEPGASTGQSAPSFTATEARRLHEKAHQAGLDAGQAARPEPMVVVQRANPFDDTSPIVRQYAPVMDGVCGFAYVTVRPGTSSFARWMKKNAGGFKAFHGGVQFSVHPFGQSLERKVAYAQAYCEVLREAGVSAYVESRMD